MKYLLNFNRILFKFKNLLINVIFTIFFIIICTNHIHNPFNINNISVNNIIAEALHALMF